MSEIILALLLASPLLVAVVILGYVAFLGIRSVYQRITNTGSPLRG